MALVVLIKETDVKLHRHHNRVLPTMVVHRHQNHVKWAFSHLRVVDAEQISMVVAQDVAEMVAVGKVAAEDLTCRITHCKWAPVLPANKLHRLLVRPEHNPLVRLQAQRLEAVSIVLKLYIVILIFDKR